MRHAIIEPFPLPPSSLPRRSLLRQPRFFFLIVTELPAAVISLLPPTLRHLQDYTLLIHTFSFPLHPIITISLHATPLLRSRTEQNQPPRQYQLNMHFQNGNECIRTGQTQNAGQNSSYFNASSLHQTT